MVRGEAVAPKLNVGAELLLLTAGFVEVLDGPKLKVEGLLPSGIEGLGVAEADSVWNLSYISRETFHCTHCSRS